jgi:hypothetical protein
MNARKKLAGTVVVLLVIVLSSFYLFFLIDPLDRRSEDFRVAVFLKVSCKENSGKNSQAVLSYLRERQMKVTKENLAMITKDPTLMTSLRRRPSSFGNTVLLPPGKGKLLLQSTQDPDPCSQSGWGSDPIPTFR